MNINQFEEKEADQNIFMYTGNSPVYSAHGFVFRSEGKLYGGWNLDSNLACSLGTLNPVTYIREDNISELGSGGDCVSDPSGLVKVTVINTNLKDDRPLVTDL